MIFGAVTFSEAPFSAFGSGSAGWSVLTIPAVEVSSTAVVGLAASVSINAPVVTLSSSGAVGVLASATIEVSAVTVSASGFRADINITVPRVDIVATGLVGSTATVSVIVPHVDVVATSSVGVVATINAPAATVAAEGYTVIDVDDTVLFVPAVTLVASAAVAIAAAYDVVIVNTRTSGHATYSNFEFNSFFTLGGSLYGCASSGIFLLEGDDDAGTPIAPTATFGVSSFGSDHNKRMVDIIGNARNAAGMTFTVTVDEVDSGSSPTYVDSTTGLRAVRAKIGRGLEGRNWQIKVLGTSGRLSLRDLVARVTNLSRYA